jgi:hypothetical protein
MTYTGNSLREWLNQPYLISWTRERDGGCISELQYHIRKNKIERARTGTCIR